MADPAPFRAVALDGGTTNTRARLIENGRIIATARRSVGVRDTVLSPGSHPLAAAVRESLEEVIHVGGGARPDVIVAAGMLSSDVGLTAVPHVIAPAGLDELAVGMRAVVIPEIGDEPILFVPGVRTPPADGPDGWAAADIMRGEECETLGALELLAATGRRRPGGECAFVWPGSHTKLVAVDTEGRIVCSQTTLAGELIQAVAQHTLLAASLPEALPEVPDTQAAASGARLAAQAGLGRAAFLVRIAALAGVMGPAERASFWLGAVLGDDAAHLARDPIFARGGPVWIGGRRSLRLVYTELLAARIGTEVAALDDDLCERASALGALAVARQFLKRAGP